MDALDQQMRLTNFALAIDEVLLHFVQIVHLDVSGRRWRRSKQHTMRGTLIVALQPGSVNCFAYRLTGEATKIAQLAVKLTMVISICRNR